VREQVVITATQTGSVRALGVASLLCAGLAAVMALQLGSTGGAGASVPDPTSVASHPADIPAAPGRFSLPPLETFGEVTERPLFSSSRRPIAAETSAAVVQTLSASLAGIVISPASSSIIVMHGDPPTLMRLKEGDNIDGWSIRSIEPSRVVLRRGAEEQQLKLHDTAPPQVATAAPAPKPEPAPKPRR
jgi:general secretion pathway protein N